MYLNTARRNYGELLLTFSDGTSFKVPNGMEPNPLDFKYVDLNRVVNVMKNVKTNKMAERNTVIKFCIALLNLVSPELDTNE